MRESSGLYYPNVYVREFHGSPSFPHKIGYRYEREAVSFFAAHPFIYIFFSVFVRRQTSATETVDVCSETWGYTSAGGGSREVRWEMNRRKTVVSF